MVSEVKKIGGSLMVRIPKKLADELGIREGDRVSLPGLRKQPDTSWVGSMPELGGWTKETKEWLRSDEDRF